MKTKWILDYTPDDDRIWICENCGLTWVFNEGTPEQNNVNFCPNCGAEIEKESK